MAYTNREKEVFKAVYDSRTCDYCDTREEADALVAEALPEFPEAHVEFTVEHEDVEVDEFWERCDYEFERDGDR